MYRMEVTAIMDAYGRGNKFSSETAAGTLPRIARAVPQSRARGRPARIMPVAPAALLPRACRPGQV